MKLPEVKAIAVQRGLKTGRMTKAEIIRSIQAAEGNSPCFGTETAGSCGQEHCLWREDCN